MAKSKIDGPSFSPSNPDYRAYEHRLTYSDLLNCSNIALFKGNLIHSVEEFEQQEVLVRELIKKLHMKFGNQSVLAALLLWSKSIWVQQESLDYARILIENELIPFKNRQKRLFLIKELRRDHLVSAVDLIRCRTEFSIGVREILVKAFVHFFEWLTRATQGTVFFGIKDPDAQKIQNRVLAPPAFTPLLERLDDRCRLVAKLLYFGGSRTLDQVLSLMLEDVDFDKRVIRFDSQIIDYPLHVFKDIRNLVGEQTSGRILLGRQDSPLNAATVFRNFKEAASQIGLGDSFSPKSLTTDC